jgi:hypothetical protein
MPLVPVALLVKSKIDQIKEDFAQDPNVAQAIVQIVQNAGGRVDLVPLKTELSKMTTNESREITRDNLRRIIKEEISKLIE